MIINTNVEGVQFDSEKNLLYNPKTRKWVKNLRFATGESKGKSVGKTKGNKYKENFDILAKGHPREANLHVRIPFGINNELLEGISKTHNEKNNTNFNFDNDVYNLIFYIIIIQNYQQRHFAKEKEPEIKYTFVSYKHFRKWVGTGVEKHLEVLIENNIILCDNHYYFNKGTEVNKALGYKINDVYFEGEKSHKKVQLSNWRLILKILELKLGIRNEFKHLGHLYKTLIDDVIILIDHLPLNEMEEYYKDEEHSFEFYNITNPTLKGRRSALKKILNNKNILNITEYIEYLRIIQDGHYYFNPKDSFGERFHSVFTNLRSSIRKWINFNGVYYEELDIVNSQMSFFSLLLSDTETVKEIIPEFRYQLDKFKVYTNEQDVIKFTEQSFNGNLYEWISTELNVKRKKAKEMMFKVLFSQSHEFPKEKTKLYKLIPNVIDLCGKYNTKRLSLIPKLCQTLESRLIIRDVSGNLVPVKTYPIATVHDSISYHPEEREVVIDIFNNSCKKYNFTNKIKLKTKN